MFSRHFPRGRLLIKVELRIRLLSSLVLTSNTRGTRATGRLRAPCPSLGTRRCPQPAPSSLPGEAREGSPAWRLPDKADVRGHTARLSELTRPGPDFPPAPSGRAGLRPPVCSPSGAAGRLSVLQISPQAARLSAPRHSAAPTPLSAPDLLSPPLPCRLHSGPCMSIATHPRPPHRPGTLLCVSH